jgi:shikimate dehydrogenase
MPHKEDVLPYLSSMTPEAQRCGSVNTVRLRNGRLEGHSTDGLGFRRSLQDLGEDFTGRRVTILGAGGAAKAIATTAVDAGAELVRVVNRTEARAQALCQGEGRMEPLGMGALAGAYDLAALRPGAPAMDCIYAPAMTPFMAAAKALGHPVANGIGMLVYQAIYAYAFFRELDFSEETVSRLGALLLEASGVPPRGQA